MRWILAAFVAATITGLAGAGHAVTPGAVTASVESAREVTGSVAQDVAARRRATHHHRRVIRHRRAAAVAR